MNDADLAARLNARLRDPVEIGGAADGPLTGETFAVKANIAVQGLVWDGASPALSDVVATAHAPAVAHVLAAGGTIVLQANLHELAFGITSANAAFGAVATPWDPSRMAGGSSGGTAAAVGAGIVSMGLGTDTGGSGRIPAAFCGCVGLRPSHGRYPDDGVLNLSPSLDTVSAMARDAAALARLDAVLAADDRDLPAAQVAELRLGVVRDPFWLDLSPEVTAHMDALLERLRRAGVVIETRDVPGIADAVAETALPLVTAETALWWDRFSADHLKVPLSALPARIASPDVAAIFAQIAAAPLPDPAGAAAMARDARRHMRDLMDRAIDGLDALIHPAVPVTAPPLGAEAAVAVGATHPLFPLLTGRALPASLAGLPALTMPAGLVGGLPCGLELTGRVGGDRDILAIAAAIEGAVGRLPECEVF
ncbi:MAG: amidase family protein [Pseudomonadota bacterium]